jgi:hypothetical protein
MEKEIHIGRLIRQRLKEQGRSVKWLAENLDCEYSSLYKKLKNSYIYTDLLCEISEILDEDFFAFYSQSLINSRNLRHNGQKLGCKKDIFV